MTHGVRWIGATMVAISALATLGCSDESRMEPKAAAPARGPMGMVAASSPPADRAKAPAEETSKATNAATAGRKIIYNAHVDLVTEDLTSVDARLTRLIELSKGYVADSDLSGKAGATRHATWKVRIPVEAYDTFIKGVTSLGELVSLKADSQDVSEEFYDLEARQTNKKVEEARLLKHLTDSTGKLDEILAVERELSRVRGEIERMQGRLRSLANLTSLTTVTINVREIKDYKPPQAPTFVTRIGRTFSDSLDALQTLGENVVLFVAGILPWIPLIAIGLGVFAWTLRRRKSGR